MSTCKMHPKNTAQGNAGVVDPKGREHKCVFQVLGQEVSYGSDELADVLSLQSYDGHYSYYDASNDWENDYEEDVDYDLYDSDYY
ncbi:hypothetical protein niasHT_034333 [Heterodera trifolii]|uniref:Uncharacterized protein n=1 Tax=Heterodera trifolii TaxID=157864 RepID=A0ABD2HSI9_9BILA